MTIFVFTHRMWTDAFATAGVGAAVPMICRLGFSMSCETLLDLVTVEKQWDACEAPSAGECRVTHPGAY